MTYFDREKLDRIWKQKQFRHRAKPLKTDLDFFLKKVINPRYKKMGQIGVAWESLLSPELVLHSYLQHLRRGVLEVMVDSAPHLYEFKMIIQEGLLEHLREACPTISVSEIKLTRGTWYDLNKEGLRVPRQLKTKRY